MPLVFNALATDATKVMTEINAKHNPVFVLFIAFYLLMIIYIDNKKAGA
jgi:hypothetical protein